MKGAKEDARELGSRGTRRGWMLVRRRYCCAVMSETLAAGRSRLRARTCAGCYLLIDSTASIAIRTSGTLVAVAGICGKALLSAKFDRSARSRAVCGLPFGSFTMLASSELQTNAMR